jgi:hypothetical protein
LNAATRQAVSAWRVKAGLPASEVMDERAWARLIAATRNPRYAQLFSAPPASTLTQQLDPRCATGRVVCISKAQKKMSYVVDGQIQFTREARFSRPGWDSPLGEFRIWYKNNDTVSKIFGERTPMPYALFYTGNVAIHFRRLRRKRLRQRLARLQPAARLPGGQVAVRAGEGGRPGGGVRVKY